MMYAGEDCSHQRAEPMTEELFCCLSRSEPPAGYVENGEVLWKRERKPNYESKYAYMYFAVWYILNTIQIWIQFREQFSITSKYRPYASDNFAFELQFLQ